MPRPTDFRIEIPDARITAIRERVARFDWDSLADAGAWDSGIGLTELRRLADYWIGDYDWRIAERGLNRFPQFVVEIDGQIIHYLHVRGSARRPLLLSHGWPGSFFEFLHVIEPLAFPERFGGRPEDGFDVVVPSLPGYGFSGRPSHPIGPRRTAELFHRLMTEVMGYRRYFAQGGDWGAAISAWIAHDYPQACAALHLNMVLVQARDAKPETIEERAHAERRADKGRQESAYGQLQGTKPQTLAVGMSDSPLGIAAWIIEKFAIWSDLPWRDGRPLLAERYSNEQLLTNVMIYLVGNSFPTSLWMYKGRIVERSSSFAAGDRITVPTAVAAFPDPTFEPPPRSQVEKTYNVKRWTAMPRGGHFAALEEPALFVDDLRVFAREQYL